MEEVNRDLNLQPTYTPEEARALRIISDFFREGIVPVTQIFPDGSVQTGLFDLSKIEISEQ